MFMVTSVCAVVTLLSSILAIWKAKLNGSSKSLRAGFVYGAISIGWAVTAFWPDAWNWGLPPLLIVALAIVNTTE